MRLQAGDVAGFARLGLGGEPRVEQLAGDLGGREAQAHDEDVGVVPFAGAGRGGGVRAQRRPHARHLVGGDRCAGPRPAEQHACVDFSLRDGLADSLTDLGPLDRLTAGRPHTHDFMAAPLEVVGHCVGQRRLLVGTQDHSHALDVTATRTRQTAAPR